MTLPTGTKLGSYEILGPLGAGGMGEVYRARDAKLDRDVAVKVLPATVANDPDALSRFEREAKAVAALSHPNILAIHDFGRQDGIAYAVTELLEGETLRGRIDSGSISTRQATEFGLQIVRGLSAAHERGIVHRDLKPDNVFVTRDGHLKILDFGLAKRVDDARPDDPTSAPTGSGHTAPGTVMGTMGYMSPEQLRGLPVDHRSDIFSFGALLYEMLSGRKAFRRDSASDTIAAILKEEPPELTGTGRAITPALDHVVRHCLEKNPGDRFQSAKDVAFALNEASGATTMTSGAAAAAPAPGSKRWIALVAAAVVVAGVAGLFLSRRAPRRTAGPSGGAPAVQRVAVLPFENLGAPEDDYFADGIADEIRGKLTSLPGVQVIARGSSTPYKKSNKTPKQIAEELGVDYLLTATVRSDKSGAAPRVQVRPELVDVSQPTPTSKWQQTFDAPFNDLFKVQSDIASQVAQSLGVALGSSQQKKLGDRPTENMAAYEAFLKGQEASSNLSGNDPPSIRKALGFYEQAVKLDPDFAQAWAQMSIARSLLYANGLGTPELKKGAREAADKAMALAPDQQWGVTALVTYHRLVEFDARAALEVLDRARNLIPGNPELVRMLGTVQINLGRFDEGLGHLREAQRQDPGSLTVIQSLIVALTALRRYGEARQIADLGLVRAPSSLILIKSRAATFLGEGDLDGARASVAETSKNVDPKNLAAYFAATGDVGWVLTEAQKQLLLTLTPADFDGDESNRALCFMQQYGWKGEAAAARHWADEARVGLEKAVRDNPNDAQSHALLGWALAYSGSREDAIRESVRATELSPVPRDLLTGPYVLEILAKVYAATGEPDKAVDTLEQLLRVPYVVSARWIAIDPNYASLRGNPRFQKLIGKSAT